MKKGKKGFTLVELMIVVVILGILAAIAIPAFIKYIRNSKTSEAKENLAYIFRESTTYFAGERVQRGMGGADVPPQFPSGDGPTPAAPGAGVKTSGGDWTTETWQALKFSLADPHYFAYTYVSAGTSSASAFTARAEGDLDGDGIQSLFERAGQANANMEVEGSRGLYEQNPLE